MGKGSLQGHWGEACMSLKLTLVNRFKLGVFKGQPLSQHELTMKTPLFASALLLAAVSLFALTNVGVAPGGTTTAPVVKPPCTKKDDDKRPTTVAPKAPEKKSDEKKDDDKRPFKK